MKKIFSNLFSKELRGRTISYLVVILAFILITIASSAGLLGRKYTSLLVPVCAYMIAAIGLNLNVGISGELNLGQAGFMSVGAFSGVVAAGILQYNGISNTIIVMIVAVLFGTLMAALLGWLISIPVLKLQGDYLAIVTLAFGQIIMNIINNIYLGVDSSGLHMSFINNTVALDSAGVMILSGPMGAVGVTAISTFTIGIIMILLSLFIVYNIIYSKSGRAIQACRDNRIAAETVGIKVSSTKTLAFVISAALAGAAGVLYGLNYASFAATKFDFNTSILILVYVVLGGLGNMTGTMVATTALVVLPEMLRFLSTYRMLIYAVVLIVIMLVTNNPTLKLKFSNLRKKGKETANE